VPGPTETVIRVSMNCGVAVLVRLLFMIASA
jgi:hypothetical protein